MKRIVLLAAAVAAFALPVSAQTQEAFPSYIQVNGRAEKEIAPDEFYLSVVIDERDSKGKISVESQQRDMIAALKKQGVNIEKQLKVANLSSEFFKKNTSVATAKYQLQLGSAAEVAKVWQALDKLGISNVSILKVSHSRIDSLKEAVRVEAIRNAQQSARIAFRVMQMIDSRTIIDQPGANQLIGRGDMLFSKDGELVRIQCALVETKEVERVVEHISKQQSYTAAYSLPDYTPETGSEPQTGGEGGAPVKFDALFAEIARTAVSGGSISTSMIQRNYEVGFNRAGRIMLQLERAGIVGRQEGAKPRDILYHDLPSLEAKLQELGLF